MTNPSENSHDRADKVCDLYFREGLNSAQIGQTLGLHRHSVINIIHRRGLKPRTAQESLRLRLGQKMPEVSDDQLRHLYSDLKLSFQAIATRLGGVSAQWVGDRFHAAHALEALIRTPQEGRWARVERLFPITDADELRDPAYEARRGIANRVYCKICGVPVTALTKHLLTRERLTRKEYRKAYPGARVTTFAQVARQLGCDVKELMARFANDYLTRSELRECVLDPKWEDLNYTPGSEPSLPDFAACRLCGLKCKGHLGRHLENEHDESLQDYSRKHPGAPTCSRAWTEKLTKRQAEIRDLAKEAAQRPADWWEKPIDWRIIGGELLSRENYMGNPELGERLDASRLLKCHYADDWETALSRVATAINYVGVIRNWVGRPAKNARKK